MFDLIWTEESQKKYKKLEGAARSALASRTSKKRSKSSKAEGLFKQVFKTLKLLQKNPRHPGLQTHEYSGLAHPWSPDGKVFEAYVQHSTPNAYRIFWCYGPKRKQITVVAITPHP